MKPLLLTAPRELVVSVAPAKSWRRSRLRRLAEGRVNATLIDDVFGTAAPSASCGTFSVPFNVPVTAGY